MEQAQDETVRAERMMITKRSARIIRAGIAGGRKFVMLAKANPGLTSYDIIGRNLRGLYGKAYSHTVLRSRRRL